MPRFGIEQGTKSDGTKKIRAVDHFSWSYAKNTHKKRKRSDMKADSVNGHYEPDVELKHDHLDDLLESARYHYELVGRVRTHLSMLAK